MMGIRLQRLITPVLLVILVISALMATGCTLVTGEAEQEPERIQEPIIEDITNSEAYALIQDNRDNENFVILDVRTPEEYADGHIAKAINLDYNSETFRDELGKLDKSKTYLIYCRSGRRSAGARDMMEELSFKTVYHMTAGILEWEAAGLPLVR